MHVRPEWGSCFRSSTVTLFVARTDRFAVQHFCRSTAFAKRAVTLRFDHCSLARLALDSWRQQRRPAELVQQK